MPRVKHTLKSTTLDDKTKETEEILYYVKGARGQQKVLAVPVKKDGSLYTLPTKHFIKEKFYQKFLCLYCMLSTGAIFTLLVFTFQSIIPGLDEFNYVPAKCIINDILYEHPTAPVIRCYSNCDHENCPSDYVDPTVNAGTNDYVPESCAACDVGVRDPGLAEGADDPGWPTPCLVVNVTLTDFQLTGEVEGIGEGAELNDPDTVNVAYGPLYQDKASWESWAGVNQIWYGDLYWEDSFPAPWGSPGSPGSPAAVGDHVYHRIVKTFFDTSAPTPPYEGAGCTAFACPPRGGDESSYNQTRDMLMDWVENTKKWEIGSEVDCYYHEGPTNKGWTGMMDGDLRVKYVPPIISRVYFDREGVFLLFVYPAGFVSFFCCLYIFMGCREWWCRARCLRKCQYY